MEMVDQHQRRHSDHHPEHLPHPAERGRRGRPGGDEPEDEPRDDDQADDRVDAGDRGALVRPPSPPDERVHDGAPGAVAPRFRSEAHTAELAALTRLTYT